MSVSDSGEKLSGERIANIEKMSECPALAKMKETTGQPTQQKQKWDCLQK
jgi:hypothetical protein